VNDARAQLNPNARTARLDDADWFPSRLRVRLFRAFGPIMIHLRSHSDPCKAVERGAWTVLMWIAMHWQEHTEAWPSQAKIAAESGFSERSIRDAVKTLERGGFLRLRRARRGDGSERIFYAPGALLVRELAAFVDQPIPLNSRAPRRASHPPATVAAGPPAGIAGKPPISDLKIMEPSSCGTNRRTNAPRQKDEDTSASVVEDDLQVARAALAARWRRKHPERQPPRCFEAGELAIVATRTAEMEGDRATKLRTHVDAIAGAFETSEGAPSVAFIWGNCEHFIDHAERGRRRRRAVERTEMRARTRAQDSEPPCVATDEQIRGLFAAIGCRPPKEGIGANYE
jgi:hypothetical protein